MVSSIVTYNLTKTYRRDATPALDGLNLSVKPGEIYGYLGANGAGKSTTIRLLMNFIRPSSGRAQIAGLDSVHDSVAIKRRVGYLAGDVALYSKVTGAELLDYLGQLHGNVDTTYRKKLEQRFEADTHKPIGTLSKGNRQKIGILQALMHRPDVLILDEPTSGLDPLMQEAFYDSLREAKARGAAMLMSSHNLPEAARVCDRIGIIKHGKLIREQTIADDTSLSIPSFRVVLARPDELSELKRTKGLKFISQEGGNTAIVQTSGSIAMGLKALSQFEIREISTRQLNLEDEFIEYYGDKA